MKKKNIRFIEYAANTLALKVGNLLKDSASIFLQLNLPIIKKLIVSSPNGNCINANLDLGGFGISRFFIDNELKKIAIENGVYVLEETKVNDVIFNEEAFTIIYNNGKVNCTVVAACFGKRSNLDVKWIKRILYKKNQANLIIILV